MPPGETKKEIDRQEGDYGLDGKRIPTEDCGQIAWQQKQCADKGCDAEEGKCHLDKIEVSD